MNQDIRHNNGEEMDPAQGDVFKLYSDALHRFFYFRTLDNEIADDLAQETITRTFQTRSELFKPGREGEIRPYLYATARHVFANYVRERTRHPIVELTEQNNDAISPNNQQQNIDNALIWEHIKQLSLVEREVLDLQYKQALPVRQIAKRLCKSINAVKLISSRAKAKLKRFEAQAQ